MTSLPQHILIICLLVLILLAPVSAAPRLFEVNETDFVKIVPEAIDADNDKITYSYSDPLDNKGEWQTSYNDAGKYNLTVTASDGKEKTTQDIILIVHNKNQAPVLSTKKIIIKETQTIDLKLTVEDPDGDALNYTFNEPFDKNGIWKTDFNDAGTHLATFKVNDGEYTTNGRVEIEVISTNQVPAIVGLFFNNSRIEVQEGTNLTFFIEVQDENQEDLEYLWRYDNLTISDKRQGSYPLNFDQSGEHTLTVTVKDEQETIEHNWTLSVENSNRKPKLTHLPINTEEGEKIILDFLDFDEDGDKLSYSYSLPFDQNGEWQTGYDDAGSHKVNVTATDGNLTAQTTVDIRIQDIDRAPNLILPQRLEVSEGSLLQWKIDVTDPDGDKINISIKNLPPEAILNETGKQLTWIPSYDELHRRGGKLSNLLSSLRLERYLMSKKTVDLEIETCGKQWCSRGVVPVTIYNVNRAPSFVNLTDIAIHETETVHLNAVAVDPDGDIVRYYYTEPLENRKWTTTFEDSGTKTVYITATDGTESTTRPVTITIHKKNRAPTLVLEDDDFTILEGQTIALQVGATDPDSDNLTIRIEDLPPSASFKDGVFLWTPDNSLVQNKSDSTWNNIITNSALLTRRLSNEKTAVGVRFAASDGEIEAVHPVHITVKNVNRAPVITSTSPVSPITAYLNEPIRFNVEASDLDGDNLTYSWDIGLMEPRIERVTSLERIFVAPGIKTVSVTVSDGRDSVEKEWKVEVLTELYNPPIPPQPTYKVFVIEYEEGR